jgi:hypothetical protein
MDLIPNRNFLFKQIEKGDGKKVDVVAKRGVMLKEVSDREAVKFWGAWDFEADPKGEEKKKKLLASAKSNKYMRVL